MKVSVTTLTGQKFEVEVEAEDTVKDLKRAFYQQKKLKSQVRLLIGQEVLHDDRKLCEYQIQDGGVISALFTPDVDVTLEVSSCYKTHKITVPNSTRVQEVKVKLAVLINNGIEAEEFDLVYQEVILKDDLPLHYYGVTTGSNLQLLRPYVPVTIRDNHDRILFRRLKRKDTILDIKTKLKESQHLDPENPKNSGYRFGHLEDMRLYLVMEYGQKYKELGDDRSVDECRIRDGAELFLLTYRWTYPNKNKVHLFDSHERCQIQGVENSETSLAVKLRVQDQLGIPVRDLMLIEKDGMHQEATGISENCEYYVGTKDDIEAERREQEKDRADQEKRNGVKPERLRRKYDLELNLQHCPNHHSVPDWRRELRELNREWKEDEEATKLYYKKYPANKK